MSVVRVWNKRKGERRRAQVRDVTVSVVRVWEREKRKENRRKLEFRGQETFDVAQDREYVERPEAGINGIRKAKIIILKKGGLRWM